MIMFVRSQFNPILKPNPNNLWEAVQVYNPAVIFTRKKYHLFYRARGRGQNRQSVIGYATSDDGIKFRRRKQPLLTPKLPIEKRGLEDPRITKISRTYFMTYTAYDGQTARLCLLTSRDLKKWQRQGEMIPNWNLKKANGFTVSWDPAQQNPIARIKWIKAGVIFPQKIKGKFWMLFGDSNIWLATSADGIRWQPLWQSILRPRKKYFDCAQLEAGPPPIKTKKGWLFFYHGIDNNITYRFGFVILNLNNPTKIIYRSPQPVLEPQEKYELNGLVDVGVKTKKAKAIFATAAIIRGRTLWLYYGAADTNICLATDLLKNLIS